MTQAECIVCNEAITQPICAICLENEMEEWLHETMPELLMELQERAEEMFLPIGEAECVLCKRHMDVCSYCFTRHILQWLKNYPELVPEFITYFNYDLHYNGYARKLLELV